MPERVDWFYHRKGCPGSRLARQFLKARGARILEETDAALTPVDVETGIRLMTEVRLVVVAWRSEVVTWEMVNGKWIKYRVFKTVHGKRVCYGTDAPHGSELRRGFVHIITARTGGLRTPTIRKGNRLLIGFSPEAARRVFRSR